MNGPDYPVLIFVALVALLWAAHRIDRWMSRRRARAHLRATLLDSLRRDLARVTGQRDRYCGLYREAVARNAALLEHIGDERGAAAVQALADSPAYFEALAAREAASLDHEWFDLSGDER